MVVGNIPTNGPLPALCQEPNLMVRTSKGRAFAKKLADRGGEVVGKQHIDRLQPTLTPSYALCLSRSTQTKGGRNGT